ncbi:hypothetical protein [Caulifigura coniformis]|nr:hypothetical protein [Caulifigura coniformis]
MAKDSAGNRGAVGVTVLLLLLFLCSVWNWLYNIPVQPNVEIPFRWGKWWMVDSAAPDEVLIWDKDHGPVSFYNMRTGEHLFDRLSDSDLDVRPSFGDSRTTLVFRDGVATVVDLRAETVRCRIPSLPRGVNSQAFLDRSVLLTIHKGTTSAFDVETGDPLWSRNDIHMFRPNWGSRGDRFCADVNTVRQIEGLVIEQRQRQVLNVRDGTQDERFDLKSASRIWMSSPPGYLVEEGGRGGTSTVYDMQTGEKLLSTGFIQGGTNTPYFNAELTELLFPYREGEYDCRLGRWDLKTGNVIHPVPKRWHSKPNLITDDGRYFIGSYTRDSPPLYGAVRRALREIGLQLPSRERATPLLVDNQAKKEIGRLEHSTSFERIELTRAGDAFVQECNDRLAIYFVPLQRNWTRLILGGAWMVISFVATAFKARTLLVHMSQVELLPARPRRKDSPTVDDSLSES